MLNSHQLRTLISRHAFLLHDCTSSVQYIHVSGMSLQKSLQILLLALENVGRF